ncbi:MAG: hypothetical protein NXI00_23580, partial [Cytophagales bacterium]|nr:hypothetical protein [Cytophagales bacterium]
ETNQYFQPKKEVNETATTMQSNKTKPNNMRLMNHDLDNFSSTQTPQPAAESSSSTSKPSVHPNNNIEQLIDPISWSETKVRVTVELFGPQNSVLGNSALPAHS